MAQEEARHKVSSERNRRVNMAFNFDSDMTRALEASRRSYNEELDRLNREAFEKGLQLSLASEEFELAKKLSLESHRKELKFSSTPSCGQQNYRSGCSNLPCEHGRARPSFATVTTANRSSSATSSNRLSRALRVNVENHQRQLSQLDQVRALRAERFSRSTSTSSMPILF